MTFFFICAGISLLGASLALVMYATLRGRAEGDAAWAQVLLAQAAIAELDDEQSTSSIGFAR